MNGVVEEDQSVRSRKRIKLSIPPLNSSFQNDQGRKNGGAVVPLEEDASGKQPGGGVGIAEKPGNDEEGTYSIIGDGNVNPSVTSVNGTRQGSSPPCVARDFVKKHEDDMPEPNAMSILPMSMRMAMPFSFCCQGCKIEGKQGWCETPVAFPFLPPSDFPIRDPSEDEDRIQQSGLAPTRLSSDTTIFSALVSNGSIVSDVMTNSASRGAKTPRMSLPQPRQQPNAFPNGSTGNRGFTGSDCTYNSDALMESLFSAYLSVCSLYKCKPNPGVLTALRFSLPTIRVSGYFHDADMLALSELLLYYSNTTLRHVTRLDFAMAGYQGTLHGRQKGFKSHGAIALSKVLQNSQHIREVYLQRNRIGPYGGAAIFRSISANPTVRTLVMRSCLIGERGALAFATHVVANDQCGLRECDLSNNGIGFQGSKAICEALVERKIRWGERNVQAYDRKDSVVENGDIEVDLEGNLILQEVMNCVTHGLGIILAIAATILLTRRVRTQSASSIAACALYSFSLLLLYTSSTLYHSFFALRTTKRIFGIFDHSAIYILIAGSYTPYLRISLSHKPVWSVYLLVFIWVCSMLGVYVEAFHGNWKRKGTFSLTMYLALGWASLVCLPDLIAVLPQGAINLLVLGGVGYTSGVPFFVRNNNLDHSIWHLFVLAGSAFHWFGVYWYVAALRSSGSDK